MAILEVNLEKPALVEEYQPRNESPAETARQSDVREESDLAADGSTDSSGGVKGKLLGLLAVAAGVGLLVWKLKSRGGSEQTDFEEFEAGGESRAEFDADEESGTEFESGAEFEAEAEFETDGGGKKKAAGILGLVVAAVGLVAVKRRN
jgi:hypothetical protein